MTGAFSAGIPGPTATPLDPRSRRLPRRWRNLLLCVHIMVAVGALSTDTILLTLGVTGLVSSDAELIRAAYLAMDLLVAAVLLPLALAALASGVLLGLGSRWGLARHWWVLAKLALTIVGASAAVLLLQPSVNQAAATALAVPLAELPTAGIGQVAVRVMLAPTLGVVLLTTAVVLAVSKPWGQTRFRRAEPGATPLPSRSQHSGPDRDLHGPGPLACRR